MALPVHLHQPLVDGVQLSQPQRVAGCLDLLQLQGEQRLANQQPLNNLRPQVYLGLLPQRQLEAVFSVQRHKEEGCLGQLLLPSHNSQAAVSLVSSQLPAEHLERQHQLRRVECLVLRQQVQLLGEVVSSGQLQQPAEVSLGQAQVLAEECLAPLHHLLEVVYLAQVLRPVSQRPLEGASLEVVVPLQECLDLKPPLRVQVAVSLERLVAQRPLPTQEDSLVLQQLQVEVVVYLEQQVQVVHQLEVVSLVPLRQRQVEEVCLELALVPRREEAQQVEVSLGAEEQQREAEVSLDRVRPPLPAVYLDRPVPLVVDSLAPLRHPLQLGERD